MSSFFADMLAGAAGGLGAGMVSMADQNRLDREKQSALDEKSALALELQRQKSEDLRYRTEDNNLTRMMIADARKGGDGSGGKGGGSGMNLMQLAMQAKTPEEQDKVINLTRVYAGDDAAAKLADQMFSRPVQETVDLNRANNMPVNDDEGNAMPSAMVTRKAGYDKDKGAQALQRVFTLALDPGKTDDQAKAERQQGQTDMGQQVARTSLLNGEGIDEAAGKFATFSNPALNTNLNDIQRSRIEASTENAATRAKATTENGAANRQARAEADHKKAVAAANKSVVDSNISPAKKLAAADKALADLLTKKPATQIPGIAPSSAKSAADAFKFGNR